METLKGAPSARSLVEVLRAARDRIARGWCRDMMAVDAGGDECSAGDETAARWCLLGSIFAEPKSLARSDARRIVREQCEPYTVAQWNDCIAKEPADVLALLDNAIAIALAEGNARGSAPSKKSSP